MIECCGGSVVLEGASGLRGDGVWWDEGLRCCGAAWLMRRRGELKMLLCLVVHFKECGVG
ncbi:hypothetical protein SOVF_177510 [Spinacia oleracea]|nr:hypothetical protein SOVF_177510 [Spinacia oleracea]